MAIVIDIIPNTIATKANLLAQIESLSALAVSPFAIDELT